MAKTRDELVAICQRRTKTEGDGDAKSGFETDLNLGHQELAELLGFQDRIKTDNFTCVVGQDVYDIASDVYKLEQLRITSPTDYEAELVEVDRNFFRAINPVTSNDSNSTPNYWYFDEAVISTTDYSQTKQVKVYPNPDQAYVITYTYRPDLPEMADGNDYPYFDGHLHHILCDYAIWKYAEREPDPTLNPSYYERQWEKGKRLLLGSLKTKSKNPPSIPGPDTAVGV